MEKDSVTTACYLGIVIFIILIFIPPFFRWLDPPIKTSNNNTNTNVKNLICEREENLENDIKISIVVTNMYVKEKLKSIKFKYVITNPMNIDESTLISKSTILNEREILKNIDIAIKEENIIRFELENINLSNTTLVQYTGGYNEQKINNSNNGYSCK